MRAVLLTALILLSGCATPSAGPQEEPGRIDGTLVDQFMHPYGNATVTLAELNVTTRTTEKGGFSFVAVPPGTYTVAATPPAGDRAAETVLLDEGDREVVILQSRRLVEDPAYKAALGREGRMVAALPGQECDDCSWTTRLAAVPDEVVLRAQWDDTLGGPLVVELYDEAGELVRRLEGNSPMWEPVDGAEFTGPHLTVKVRASDDPVPRADVHVRTALDVYYGGDRNTQEA